MKMFDDNGRFLGNKTVTAGAGQQRPDGSYGNSVSMQFKPAPEPKQNHIISSLANSQQQVSNFPNNYPNGIKPPQVHLRQSSGDSEDVNNFLQYRADIRNANMQKNYDAMNMKNNNFLSTLANSKFQSGQNRLAKESMFNRRLTQNQHQYDNTMDFNKNKFDKNYQLNQDKFYFQKQTAGTKPTDMKSRAKIFDTMYKGYYDENTSDALDDNEVLKSQARNYYMQHGKMPNVEAYDGDSWFDNDYRITNNNQQQQQTQQYNAQKVVGNKKYVQKNGKWYEL